MMPFHVIIPARYHSSRLPGKLLMDLHGQSILERVYRQAQLALPKSVMIATDEKLIEQACRQFGAEAFMTSAFHESGTDRLAEVVVARDFLPDDVIVNVQGDEPLIPPELIVQVAASLADKDTSIATLCWPIHDKTTIENPNVVKVVRNALNQAIYFSRSPIPFQRIPNQAPFFRHIGLYAYRASFLKKWANSRPCSLEQSEGLEQLRMLWEGHSIKVTEACVPPQQDINSQEDLEQARLLFSEVE